MVAMVAPGPPDVMGHWEQVQELLDGWKPNSERSAVGGSEGRQFGNGVRDECWDAIF